MRQPKIGRGSVWHRLRHFDVLVVCLMLLSACNGSSPSEGTPSEAAVDATNRDAYAVRIADCLTDRGWEASVDEEDGSLVVSGIPDAQRSRFQDDQAACQEEVGPRNVQPITEQRATDLHAALVESAECIEDLGYRLPEPPSQEAAAMLEEPPRYLWDPYEYAMESIDEVEDLDELLEECPQP